jgi:hypothetical protein
MRGYCRRLLVAALLVVAAFSAAAAGGGQGTGGAFDKGAFVEDFAKILSSAENNYADLLGEKEKNRYISKFTVSGTVSNRILKEDHFPAHAYVFEIDEDKAFYENELIPLLKTAFDWSETHAMPGSNHGFKKGKTVVYVSFSGSPATILFRVLADTSPKAGEIGAVDKEKFKEGISRLRGYAKSFFAEIKKEAADGRYTTDFVLEGCAGTPSIERNELGNIEYTCNIVCDQEHFERLKHHIKVSPIGVSKIKRDNEREYRLKTDYVMIRLDFDPAKNLASFHLSPGEHPGLPVDKAQLEGSFRVVWALTAILFLIANQTHFIGKHKEYTFKRQLFFKTFYLTHCVALVWFFSIAISGDYSTVANILYMLCLLFAFPSALYLIAFRLFWNTGREGLKEHTQLQESASVITSYERTSFGSEAFEREAKGVRFYAISGLVMNILTMAF